MPMTRFSIVITSYNQREFIKDAVDSALAQTKCGVEIVVVDDGSTDGSTAGFRRAIKAPGIGVARARNLGAAQSEGDVLVFADGHIRLDKLWWQPLADVVGRRRPPKSAPTGPAGFWDTHSYRP